MAEKVPRLVPGVDIRSFKLDPMDGFLMTRIDGKLGPKELGRETGLPDFSVARALEKLEKLGIIQLIDPNAPPPPPPQAPAERKSAIAQFDAGLLAPKYDPKELEEPADLTPEQKKRILDFFYRLDDLDHYTLLGITAEADKKGVKRAYFELAATFHPDRYFKKELGSFKPKMEELFNRITEAHDTLADAATRAEYDAYLAEVATTRGMEAMLERAMAESARAAAEAARAVQAAPPPPVPTAPPQPTGPSPDEIRRRKEALARRLTGGVRPPQASRPPSDKPNPLRYSNPQDAMDALKRRYEDRLESATQAHAQRYVQAAEDALAKNDLVAASTAFNIATKFAPDDVDLAMRAQEVKNLADKLLAESYLKQAQYEERQGHWFEAGRSWQKVAKIRNDAVSHERAANALLHSPEGDLHEAAEHAKQAITLQPGVIENHVTLVEVYLKAGLTASARRAAEAANALDPKHPPLLALLKRLGK
ncbi:MAG: DnaJ domain-containing protein [Labilithrix sp.]|nr:DnaJ domain-containing protein [Labilithrix sp.]